MQPATVSGLDLAAPTTAELASPQPRRHTKTKRVRSSTVASPRRLQPTRACKKRRLEPAPSTHSQTKKTKKKTNDDETAQWARLEAKLDVLASQLRDVQASTANMDRHIDFVERLWRMIRRPVGRVLGVVASLRDRSSNVCDRQVAVTAEWG